MVRHDRELSTRKEQGEESMPLTSHVQVFCTQVGFLQAEVQSCAPSREIRDEF
jgi:hypothetical protein